MTIDKNAACRKALDESAAEAVFQKFKYVKPRLNRAAIGLICSTYESARAFHSKPSLAEVLEVVSDYTKHDHWSNVDRLKKELTALFEKSKGDL